ncbi:helix-turn-helix domain-containing protein [Streptomyces roseirectus]|uniref:Helix-turn-helix domain-containing protein n=1 Tax=Streptomyces roseirectus TaxID=2768066 RepID=A0A7H0IR00_9ACTN|nr:helix-turn-helix domain-containing protein [Streptomyces roseirectus]QNP75216.1 helix-turn-helix domain-containing protein [Streptomyces roseirectus]
MSNAHLPAQDRFAFWADLVSTQLARMRLTSPIASRDFVARASLTQAGPVRVAWFRSPPAHLSRTWADVRADDPGVYQLMLVTGGAPLWIQQRRQDSGLLHGALTLFDLSEPFCGSVPDRGHDTEVIIAQIPHTALPLPVDRARRALALPFAASGIGGILADHMTSIRTHGPDCDPRDLERMGLLTADLAGALIARRLDAYPQLPPQTRQDVMRARILAFIDLNLADPDLDPAAIAAFHHLSLRTLHTLFHRHDEGTVAALIRRRRLERCRTDLTDPRLDTLPAAAIGARWGLHHPQGFNRAFRAMFGLPPAEYRRTARNANQPRTDR